MKQKPFWAALSLILAGVLFLFGAGSVSGQIAAALPAPVPVAPLGIQTVDLPTYQWSPVTGAVQYNLVVYWNGGGRYVIKQIVPASACDASVCSYLSTVNLRNGSYKFKVQATDSTNINGPYSGWGNFSVAVHLPAPVQVAPEGETPNSQPVYQWNGVDLATRYRMLVYSSSGHLMLSRTLKSQDVCSSGVCSYKHPSTLKGGSYRWRVSAGSTYTWGPYSIYKVFTIPTYVLVGWNDLGMHCYNRDFSDLAVLPPYNNLWAQVIQRGDPPKIVTQNIRVEYSFPTNTYSVGKSNFWTYAQQLFNLPGPLSPNVGLTGKGLAGSMDVLSDHFTAEGIPLTEYNDNNWITRYPFQKAELVAKQADNNAVLAHLTVVAPVSTEMRCDRCHSDGQQENIATGKVETNILTLHDLKNKDKYPDPYTGKLLMDSRPVLCANCHASNALALPGMPNIPNLSKAMHGQHAEKVSSSLDGCYSCHPGPQTKCLRDVMSQEGMICSSCHGRLEQVAQNPNPWLHEPRCDECHDVKQNNDLYRHSTAHNGIYCEACHDSTHAIAPSTQANDAIKFKQLQGHGGPLDKCTVCHTKSPGGDIHGGD